MTVQTHSVFRFADVEVREQELRATRAGEALAIEPKAFRVLLYLLRHAGHLVTKNELLDAVWGETAVTENSLTRAVALLRRVLEDDPYQPQFIETVATAGYRFVCPVEAEDDSSGIPVTTGAGTSVNGGPALLPATSVIGAAATKTTLPGAKRRLWVIVGASAMLLAFVAGAVWYLRRPLPPPRITNYVQLTNDGRYKYIAGTDGARLYLNWSEESFASTAAEVAVSGGEVTHLAVALPNPWLLDVSPDGSTILVGSFDGVRESLWSVRVPGNSVRHLADTGRLDSATWSPDGQRVVYSALDGDKSVITIMRSDGADSHRISIRSSPTRADSLAWSPDGSSIRFQSNNKLWEMSSDGSGLHQLLPGWRISLYQCCGRWTTDGKSFVFLLQDSRAPGMMQLPSQIWSLDERRHRLFGSGRNEPVQLTSGPIRWNTPVSGRDGKRMFASGVIPRGELNRYDAKSHELRPYLGGISAEHFSFSRDGQFMAYVTFPGGILWRAKRDGSDPEQLTSPPLYPTQPRWSPDGAQILFSALDENNHPRSYIIPAHGGTPQPILPEDKDPQNDPNWSPDGRKIMFDSDNPREFGPHLVIRILDLASHKVTDLPGNVWSPRWSPDGRFVAALSVDDLSLTVFDFETQRWSILEKGRNGYPAWSRDGQFIYFLRPWGNDPGVFRIRRSGGDAKRIVDLKGFRFTGTYAFWMGLDPNDTPMLLRDVGTDDIYALTLERK